MSAAAKPISTSMDPTGLLQPRRLRLQPALIVAASLVARLDRARDAAPPDLRPRFEAYRAQLLSDVEGIADAQRRPSDSPALAPPAEVLALVSAEVALSPRAVNNDIDNRVGIIMDTVRAHARRGPTHPLGAAAQTLQASVFAEGLSFLTLSGPLQWLAVEQRFERPAAEVVAAMQALGVGDVLSEIQTMNAWFGRLLNITEAPNDSDEDDPPAGTPAARRRAALDRLLSTFTGLVSLSNVAWPSAEPSDQRPRLALLGPYLSAIQAASAQVSRQIREAAAAQAAAQAAAPQP